MHIVIKIKTCRKVSTGLEVVNGIFMGKIEGTYGGQGHPQVSKDHLPG